jgi:hypothetical protein
MSTVQRRRAIGAAAELHFKAVIKTLKLVSVRRRIFANFVDQTISVL